MNSIQCTDFPPGRCRGGFIGHRLKALTEIGASEAQSKKDEGTEGLREYEKGEWEKGRVGEKESGRKGEWEKGRMGEGEKMREGEKEIKVNSVIDRVV